MTSAGHHVMLEGASEPPAPAYWGLCFTAEEPNVVVDMAKTGSPPAVTLETSTDDGETWTAFDADGGTTPITLAAAGDHVFFRAGTAGNAKMSSSKSAYRTFTLSGRCAASGNCMSLISASDPTVVFTSTNTYAFANLFYDCTQLTSAPELPSSYLPNNCYRYMFSGCSLLRRSPRLGGYIMQGGGSISNCYLNMFQDCPSMELVEVLVVPPGQGSQSSFAGLFNRTGSPRGVVRTLEASAEEAESVLSEGWTVETIPHPFAVATSSGLSVACKAEMVVSLDLGETWTTYAAGTSVSVGARRVAMFRSTRGTDPTDAPGTVTVPTSGNVVLAGDMATLAVGSGNVTSLPGQFFYSAFTVTGSISTSNKLRSRYLRVPAVTSLMCYVSLFSGRKDLLSAPKELPATTLAQECYAYMFYGCTSLTAAPALPATTLTNSCYQSMFQGCTSLASVPALSCVTTLPTSCYASMFRGCTSLTDAPDIAVETMSSQCCYSMFEGCTSLVTMSAVSATTTAKDCFRSMFANCTSLTTASTVSATTMSSNSCREMFSGCTALVAAPSLPATTLAGYCYNMMFYGCTSLTTAPALPATIMAEHCYDQMFFGCTSLTTAPALPATIMAEDCYARMFQRCTSLTTAPALPATTLAPYCYIQMFEYCASLTTAPALPATTLGYGCYLYMFRGCTALTWIELAATSWTDAVNSFSEWVNGVAATGTFRCPAALGTDATIERGTSRCPSGWTVVNID